MQEQTLHRSHADKILAARIQVFAFPTYLPTYYFLTLLLTSSFSLPCQYMGSSEGIESDPVEWLIS